MNRALFSYAKRKFMSNSVRFLYYYPKPFNIAQVCAFGTVLFIFIVGLILLNINNELEIIQPGASNRSEFLVDQAACHIIGTDTFPGYIQNQWKIETVPDCSYERQFSSLVENDTVLLVDPNYLHAHKCSLHSINLDGWATFLRTLGQRNDVSDVEIFFVQCGQWYNFHQRLKFEHVRSKVDHWQSQKLAQRPISVLFIGFNAVSRSHFLRSLPKTRETLEALDFVDLKGFHSLGANGAVNMAAFILGFKSCLQGCDRVFENQCVVSMGDYLDDCPMIFKDFAKHHYVTSYVDNSEHASSPFPVESPMTDFYVNTIFDVVKQRRESSAPDKNRRCMSTKSEVNFMLDYMRKFIKGFSRTPFFSFLWFGGPFHSFPFSLSKYDQEFTSFIRHIPQHMYRRTLVIISGDHGDKHQLYASGVDGYIERSLPPLFIRLPEDLSDAFTWIQPNMKVNSHRLTSAFDIHHTLLHLLNLQFPNSENNVPEEYENKLSLSEVKFNPSKKDRDSLFNTVPKNRDCATIHVHESFCACEVTGKSVPVSKEDLRVLSGFAVEKLNDIVKKSKFSRLCAEWQLVPEDILAHYLVNGAYWDTILLRFYGRAKEHKHKFEMQVNVTLEDISMVTGSLARIDSVGNETRCINPKSSHEQLIKELCCCHK